MGMQKTIKMNVGTTQDLWPHQVVDEIQKVMEEGLKKHPDGEGWKLSVDEQIHRATNHLHDYFIHCNYSDLAHAFTRLMMAVAIECGYVKEGADA